MFIKGDMSLGHVSLILLFIIVFLIGLLIIIYSKTFINWLFDFGTRILKGSGDVPYTKRELKVNLWTFRIVGVILMVVSVLTLYALFSDIHWWLLP